MNGDMTWSRAIRFGLTGILVTGVHAVVASAWITWVHPLPSVANGVAFSVATIVSFLINTHWSFSSRLTHTVAIRYGVTVSIGLLGAMALSHAVYLAGLSYWLGIALVVFVMPMFNFLMHHYWTYRT